MFGWYKRWKARRLEEKEIIRKHREREEMLADFQKMQDKINEEVANAPMIPQLNREDIEEQFRRQIEADQRNLALHRRKQVEGEDIPMSQEMTPPPRQKRRRR